MATTLMYGEHLPENVLKHKFLGLISRDNDSVGLERALRIFISNTHQGDGKSAREGLYFELQAARSFFVTL